MRWLRRDKHDDEPADVPEESSAGGPVGGAETGDDAGAEPGTGADTPDVGTDTRVAAAVAAGDGPSPVDGRAEPDIADTTLIASTDVPVAVPADSAVDDPADEFAPASSPVPADPMGDGPDEGEPPADPVAERRALIDLLIYAWDRARSPGVWERLTEGLAAVGVSVLKPDGEAFDPSAHEVGGTQDTDDDALVDRVAETEVVGFADRGRVIREPIVVVYRRR